MRLRQAARAPIRARNSTLRGYSQMFDHGAEVHPPAPDAYLWRG
jgi:hypothetical protein